MVKVAPSILAADFDKLEEEIKDVVHCGADLIHIDVMDGIFVPNKTMGLEMYRATLNCNTLLDTHLMVVNPLDYIEQFKKSSIISFHTEVLESNQVLEMIERLHENSIKVSIAINPSTPISNIEPYLDKIDMVLVMTVEPGFGGQKMIEKCLEKVQILRKINSHIDIEVDGGINLNTCKLAKEAGANILVAGTAIFKSRNRKGVIKELKK